MQCEVGHVAQGDAQEPDRPQDSHVAPAGLDESHFAQLRQLLVDGLAGGADHLREVPLLILGYVWAPRTWVAGELVTASMMNTLRDLFNAIRNSFFPRQVFRGLTLRTHPDADKVAFKIWLDHADEIVVDDGEKYTDVNDLSAD